MTKNLKANLMAFALFLVGVQTSGIHCMDNPQDWRGKEFTSSLKEWNNQNSESNPEIYLVRNETPSHLIAFTTFTIAFDNSPHKDLNKTYECDQFVTQFIPSYTLSGKSVESLKANTNYSIKRSDCFDYEKKIAETLKNPVISKMKYSRFKFTYDIKIRDSSTSHLFNFSLLPALSITLSTDEPYLTYQYSVPFNHTIVIEPKPSILKDFNEKIPFTLSHYGHGKEQSNTVNPNDWCGKELTSPLNDLAVQYFQSNPQLYLIKNNTPLDLIVHLVINLYTANKSTANLTIPLESDYSWTSLGVYPDKTGKSALILKANSQLSMKRSVCLTFEKKIQNVLRTEIIEKKLRNRFKITLDLRLRDNNTLEHNIIFIPPTLALSLSTDEPYLKYQYSDPFNSVYTIEPKEILTTTRFINPELPYTIKVLAGKK